MAEAPEAPSRHLSRSKERISEVAMHLFMDQGYENVTVESVAAEAGVSRRTVFRYFPTKDELPFPDHAGRRDLMARMLSERHRGGDPVQDVMDVTEAVLRDFVAHRELVLSRYALTREVPQLAQREILEHEKYVTISRRHLERHLGEPADSYKPTALAAMIDGVHRFALSAWARSRGTSDAMADLADGMRWIRSLVDAAAPSVGESDSVVLAVLPNRPETRRALRQLVGMSEDVGRGEP